MENINSNDAFKRKRGPVASGLKTAQYTLLLESDTAEWGKTQSGGLSELVRRLLREEYERMPKAKPNADAVKR